MTQTPATDTPPTLSLESTTAPASFDAKDTRQHARRWWILGVLAVGQLMVVLDVTIVNIALPSAQRALGFSNDQHTATIGVDTGDAGVASATVNVGQQIGGSIGTALLSTIVASAASNYLNHHATTLDALARGAIHSYTIGFAWAAGIFTVGAVICGLLLRPGPSNSAGPTVIAM